MKKNDLHSLIHALSGNEKRYFRLRANPDSVYIQLFDALLDQVAYDEAALLKRFEGEAWLHRLASEKNYLMRHLLKTMRAFRTERDVHLQVRGLIADGEFLWQRNLFERAAKVFLRGQALAEQIEDHLALLEISRWIRRLPKYVKGMAYWSSAQGTLEQQKMLLDRLNEEYRYRFLYDKVIQPMLQQYQLSQAAEHETLQDLLQDDLLCRSHPPEAFMAQHYYYQILGVVHRLLGHPEKARNFLHLDLKAWQKKPEMAKSNVNSQLFAMNNYLSACVDAEIYGEIPAVLKGISLPATASPQEKLAAARILHNFSLLYLSNGGEVATNLPSVPKSEKWFLKNQERLPRSTRMIFSYNLAAYFFTKAQYSAANKWIGKFHEAKENELREDALASILLLEILVRYELEQFDLLSYQLRGLRRRNKKPGPGTVLLNKLCLCLDKLLSLPGLNEKHEVFQKLACYLKDLPKGNNRDLVLFWVKDKLPFTK